MFIFVVAEMYGSPCDIEVYFTVSPMLCNVNVFPRMINLQVLILTFLVILTSVFILQRVNIPDISSRDHMHFASYTITGCGLCGEVASFSTNDASYV